MIPDDDFVDGVDWSAVLGLFLQPLATVTAGALAVLAAVIAYRAVTRQISANAVSVQKQIDANALAVSAQIAADRSERRRAERLELVDHGAALVTKLAQIAIAYELYGGTTGFPANLDWQQREKEKFYELEVLPTTLRMEVWGMPETSAAVEAVYEEARIMIVPLPGDPPATASTVRQKKEQAISTLKASLVQEVKPAPIGQGGQ
ncbi:hypothetical protein A5641_12215 [Mycobacterium sp. 1554424.7]|nr:hypothetical protein A5641_12215 [Mycobacterium sp. 1554424.7]